MFEKDVVLNAHKIQSLLTKHYENVEVKMSRTSDVAKSLAQRTNEANAWMADFYLHCKASNRFTHGYEDNIHNSNSASSLTAIFQDIMHTEIMRVNQLKDCGQKKANFYVLRKMNMPAILTENGFIDNGQDSALMKDSSWIQKVAQRHVNGLIKTFNLKCKPVILKLFNRS
ncbi:N-acetylmuramoyl-L-alanine amidase [Peribacillus frigoritolerans]|uniref:N-acetylmuramoyl-L-alanine amidase family protein n=1 Tax=Peribacillus frigoritolerans TaxID=450367 RepID=UPI00207A0209|nr:N-acetylmuramoyl-L-alanine amidase [Peribacillus frigoritolerans]WJE49345.1 N-acetylmuramoyl-L-alanine amidase [Peribacillus frigoritolerans]